MTKSQLRPLYLEKRRAVTDIAITEMSRKIADTFFSTFDLRSVSSLHCYISISKFKEVDTSFIFERIWNEFANVRTYAPLVDHKVDRLEHIHYTSKSALNENGWGIREPVGDQKAEPGEFGLVLVPLLCADERGYRVGYGKGYYDKFLAECRPDCSKVGLSFFPPIDRIDDLRDGDIPLDMFILPDSIYRFSTLP